MESGGEVDGAGVIVGTVHGVDGEQFRVAGRLAVEALGPEAGEAGAADLLHVEVQVRHGQRKFLMDRALVLVRGLVAVGGTLIVHLDRRFQFVILDGYLLDLFDIRHSVIIIEN